MKNKVLESRLNQEIKDFIESKKSLLLSSIQADGSPYASYAPFSIGEECLYILISEIAIHAKNLQIHPKASVLIIEDEETSRELFARVRVNYLMEVEHITVNSAEWPSAIQNLTDRLGERILGLSKFSDFKLFKLKPLSGRFVKDFGRAYTLTGQTLYHQAVEPLRDGHQPRAVA